MTILSLLGLASSVKLPIERRSIPAHGCKQQRIKAISHETMRWRCCIRAGIGDFAQAAKVVTRFSATSLLPSILGRPE
jgi:hypothetical protein